MHRRHLLVCASLLLLGACQAAEDDKDDTDVDVDTDVATTDTDCADTTAECPPALDASVPADNATDQTYDAPIVLTFDGAADPTLDFSLVQDADGTPVPLDAAQWSDDSSQVVIWPASPLTPSTAYRLQVAPQCGTCPDVLAFSTTASGTAVSPDDVAGKTYVFDFGSATFARPAGLDGIASTLLGFMAGSAAIAVGTPDGTTGDIPLFVGALPDDTTQDPCAATVDLPDASYAQDPRFGVSAPEGLSVPVGDVSVPFERFELTGVFAPGGDAIEGMVLQASVDTRDLRPLLGTLVSDEGDDGVCAYIEAVTHDQVACSPCASGAGDFCLDLLVVGLGAEVGAGSLTRITADDVAGNDACGG